MGRSPVRGVAVSIPSEYAFGVRPNQDRCEQVGLYEPVVEVKRILDKHSAEPKQRFASIGADDRYYETMAFHSNAKDKRYHDADVARGVYFKSPWSIGHTDADDEANDMHEAVVAEISNALAKGATLENNDQ